MNLIITGENPKNLAIIEALAKELGLFVSRELATSGAGAGKIARRLPGRKTVESANSAINERIQKDKPSREGGPLYGIE